MACSGGPLARMSAPCRQSDMSAVDGTLQSALIDPFANKEAIDDRLQVDQASGLYPHFSSRARTKKNGVEKNRDVILRDESEVGQLARETADLEMKKVLPIETRQVSGRNLVDKRHLWG